MNNLNAVFGIAGTLLGTILGWLLNQLSSKGKLRIYSAKWEDGMTHHDDYGSVSEIKNVKQLQFYSYKCTLDIYNSSSDSRIMRDIKVVFMGKNEMLLSSTPLDDSTRPVSSVLSFYDEIAPITIGAKSVIQITIRNSEQSGTGLDSFIWKTKKIYLSYRNERNKLRKVLIRKEDYSKRFEKYTKEGPQDGQTENAQPE